MLIVVEVFGILMVVNMFGGLVVETTFPVLLLKFKVTNVDWLDD